MSNPLLIIKVDVDTERGTKIGVPALSQLFKKYTIPATFFFSLGPDNTGRAIKRIFRSGFLKKVLRTNVASVYGWRTLMNGLLWPGPPIGKRHAALMQQIAAEGFEVGIHCYDHIRWQDGLATMTAQEVTQEFGKATNEFTRIFEKPAHAAAAAGWQANAFSLATYDTADLLYGSDTRGTEPFFPMINGIVYNTLQIPTTLPTLDELLGHIEPSQLTNYYLSLLRNNHPNILTIHAELEGMAYLSWFEEFIQQLITHNVQFQMLTDVAKTCLSNPASIPVCIIESGEVPGRSGTLAMQGVALQQLPTEVTTRHPHNKSGYFAN